MLKSSTPWLLICLFFVAVTGTACKSSGSGPSTDTTTIKEPPITTPEPPIGEPEPQRVRVISDPYANYGAVWNILPPGQKANGGLEALVGQLPLEDIPALGEVLELVLSPTTDGLQELVNALSEQTGLIPALTKDENLTDQLDMYAALAKAPQGLTNNDLSTYFKLAPMRAAEEGSWKNEVKLEVEDWVVNIKRDDFGVPHIYGEDRADGLFGFGYVTAADRLFILDVLRRAGRGELSKFLGPADFSFDYQIAAEAPYREEDRTKQIEYIKKEFGADGLQGAEDLKSFIAGLNYYVGQVRKGLLNAPIEYLALGVPLDDFVEEDVVSIATLIQGIFAGGGGAEVKNVLLLQALEDELGSANKACELWRDMRHAEDPDTPVNITAEFATQSPATIDTNICPLIGEQLAAKYPAAVMFDKGSYEAYQPLKVQECNVDCPNAPTGSIPSLPLFNILGGLAENPQGTVTDIIEGVGRDLFQGIGNIFNFSALSEPTKPTQPSLLTPINKGFSFDADVYAALLDNTRAPLKTPRMRAAEEVAQMLKGLNQLRSGFPATMSNALLLNADRSASGHPLAVFGPQTAYFEPQLLIEASINAGDFQSRGMAFAGLPYILIGRGPDFAWSATSANADLTDIKVLELCGSGDVFHGRSGFMANSECVNFELIEDEWAAKWNLAAPGDPLQNYAVKRKAIRAPGYGVVVGYATVNGSPVAVTSHRSTYEYELDTALPFMQVSRNDVYDVQSFYDVFANVTGSFNWFYIDDTNIATFTAGKYPVRADEVNPELPSWGGQGYDWKGFIEQNRHPHAANPERGFIQSWNNKQAPGWWAADGYAVYGSIHRAHALEVRLKALADKGGVTLAEMVEAMGDAAFVDIRGQELLPPALDLLGTTALTEDQQQVMKLLRDWVDEGAFRRDRDGDDQYDAHAAVAFMDAWFPHMVEKLLPQIVAMENVEGRNLNLISNRDETPSAQGSAYNAGYYGYLRRVIEQALDITEHPYRQLRCADSEDANECSDALLASFDAAIEELGGVESMASWDVDMTKEMIEHRPIGLTTVPKIPWQNRPTFQQAVEFRTAR